MKFSSEEIRAKSQNVYWVLSFHQGYQSVIKKFNGNHNFLSNHLRFRGREGLKVVDEDEF